MKKTTTYCDLCTIEVDTNNNKFYPPRIYIKTIKLDKTILDKEYDCCQSCFDEFHKHVDVWLREAKNK